MRGTHRAGDDVDFDFKPHAAHAHRFTHVFLAVDDEFLRQDMQDLLIHRDVDGACGLDHAINVKLRNLAIFDGDHAVRVEAFDVRTGNTGDDVTNFHVRHQFSLFQRALNTGDRGFDVDHYAFFQSARRVLANAQHLEASLVGDLGDNRDDLRGADIESHNQILGFAVHAFSHRFVSAVRDIRYYVSLRRCL